MLRCPMQLGRIVLVEANLRSLVKRSRALRDAT